MDRGTHAVLECQIKLPEWIRNDTGDFITETKAFELDREGIDVERIGE